MRKIFSIVSIMKKMAPLLFASVLLLPLAARAEIKGGSAEATPFVGFGLLENRQNLKNGPVFGGRLGYNFTNYLGIEVSGEYIKNGVDDKSKKFTKEGQFTSPTNDVDIIMYHLDLVYHFMPEEKFNPFIVAGYGAANYHPKINSRNLSIIDFGVGAKYWLADNIALRVDLRDDMVLDETIHNFQATLGVVFAFGGDKKAAEVVSAEKSAVVGTAIAIASADTTPPTVTFTSPSKGSTDVEINRRVHVAFSEDMDPETITASTFSLKQGLTPVSGKVASGPSTATFTPRNYLEKGKSYTATVTSGAKDLAGNELASNYEWEFATGMVEDTTAPMVSFTSPVDGATAAPVKQKINVAFSEYMDPATITGATFTLKQGSTPVSGRVTSNAATATFTSFNNLEKGRPYTGTITTGARDLAGNALAKDYVWHFIAFASPKVIAVLATLENSHFAFNSAEISEDGKTILKHNVQTLKDDPKMKILVSGYASAAGTEEYNQKLSERRAESVKEYLIKTGGINGNRITSIGYGESHPTKYEADPSDKYSEAALANMRVIVEVIEEL